MLLLLLTSWLFCTASSPGAILLFASDVVREDFELRESLDKRLLLPPLCFLQGACQDECPRISFCMQT
jgi:hypothetical protein